MLIKRVSFLKKISDQLRIHQVCGILGPRQCGKTTLAREYSKTYNETVHHFDLENPEDLIALTHPMRSLEHLSGLVIIDEIQRCPDLFPILRVLADLKRAHFLILGSASRDLIRQSSESLAGRIGYIELTPLSIYEGCDPSQLLIRGGFPHSFLSLSDSDSLIWRKSYIRTFLEQDIPNLGFRILPLLLQRFWMMLSHYHGQLLNMDQIGKSLSLSGPTVRHYLDILAGTFMVRILHPWFENTHKRQIKTPKLYIRDSGLMNALSRIESIEDMNTHPLKGAIWEGFALEEVIRGLNIDAQEAFFWRTQNGAELDLLIFKNGKKYGIEFKFSDAPHTTKSMRVAIEDLKLHHLFVVYPGQKDLFLDDMITGCSIEKLLKIFQA